MKIMGIDPGKKGGFCLIDRIGGVEKVEIYSMPMTLVGTKEEYDTQALCNIIKKADYAFIEKVHAMPGEGVTSMFSFGFGYGLLIGILSAFKIPYNKVTPQAWKKVMMAGMKKDKGASILKAKELNPEINLRPTPRSRVDSDGMAEAYLIAKYGEIYGAAVVK